MRREFGIPFVAWVGAAVLAHLLWTTGADRVARVVEDFSRIRWFVESVSAEVARAQQVEISLEDMPLQAEDDSEQSQQERESRAKDKMEQPPSPAESEPEPPVESKPKPSDPIQLFPVPSVEAPKVQVVPEIKKDQRIAVKQHVKDKDQPDNPNARFIGDEANHVQEETVARITSHDQDDQNPTPGGQHSSEDRRPGNADETKIGDSEDREGEPDKAPGEHVVEEKEGKVDEPPARTASAPSVEPKAGDPARVAARDKPMTPQPPPQPTTGREEAEPLVSGQGTYSLDPRRKKKPVDTRSPGPSRLTTPNRVGLGAGPNERGIQTNLTMDDVVASVGRDELARQRAADGERRRSQHRGSWHSSSFERWRGAIENYVSSVRPGNQTALNTARVPFATYLVQIHNRIHPVFADTFLASLDALPFDHPINDYKLMARLEIVVEPNSGRVIKMGVIKTSGITSFDVGALDSVQRAGPFGKAPSGIISTDGNVYLHWEFHRNPIYACSTMNAHPYMLRQPPPIHVPDEPPRDPKPPADPRERGVPPGSDPAQDRSRYGKRGSWRRAREG